MAELAKPEIDPPSWQELYEVERVLMAKIAERDARLQGLVTALRRIRSLEPKNAPKYAQQIASEALNAYR